MAVKHRQHKVYPEKFPESWASGWGEDEYGIWMEFTYKGVVQRFRWCEPGTFLMGSPEDEPGRESLDIDETQHEVTISEGFWIADTAVSQGLWETVMGDNPSDFKGKFLPVEGVSWADVQGFIQTLNDTKPILNLSLPTEAQWEYACRSGSLTPFSWGDYINSDIANFRGTSPYNSGEASKYRQKTVEVNSLNQNPWGLFQMHGNVVEWCQDWHDIYPTEPVTDPTGPESGEYRILRGGSWLGFGEFCRSACRNAGIPEGSGNSFGFRLVRGN